MDYLRIILEVIGAFSHVAFVRNGTAMALYVDGSSIKTSTVFLVFMLVWRHPASRVMLIQTLGRGYNVEWMGLVARFSDANYNDRLFR